MMVLALVLPLLLALTARADNAYVLRSPPDGENASLVLINTSIPENVSSIVLPATTQVTLGSVLNLGDRVFVGVHQYVVEVDTATETVTRSYSIPGVSAVDRLILDPNNSSRMLVLVPLVGIWTLDLESGASSEFITDPATSFGIRPGTRELFVTTTTAFYLYSFDVDTGAALNSTSISIEGVWNMHFVDEDVLLLHGYGIGRYNVADGSVAPLCETVNSDGWGYDWMIANDGVRIVQPGPSTATNRIRNASDCAVIATGFPETNFYYGSIANGIDGTFIASGGDYDTGGSMGVGKVRVGEQDTNFSFIAEFDLGDANVIVRGQPYSSATGWDFASTVTTAAATTASPFVTTAEFLTTSKTTDSATTALATTTNAAPSATDPCLALTSQAYVLRSPPDGQNASLLQIDTSVPNVTGSIVLPAATQVTLGSVLNLGDRVYVGVSQYVVEVDTATQTVTRSYYIPGIAYVDRLILDPKNSSRMLVLVPLDGIWTLDLDSGATSEFITDPATSFGIRPGTRELFVTSSNAFYLYSFDVDTGALLTSTSIGIEGVWNMHFVDEDVLLLHGYGIGRYNVTGGSVAPLCETVNSDGWGYDWMIANDGERIVQPGYTTNRIRAASDCAVLATDIPETNFYYGSIAPGTDGTFIASGGDLDTDGSMGVGKFRVGEQDSNFSFVAEFDLGDGNAIVRGAPYWRPTDEGCASKHNTSSATTGTPSQTTQVATTTASPSTADPYLALGSYAYVLQSPPDGQNASLVLLDTSIPNITWYIHLPVTTQVTLGSVLNLGDRVFVGVSQYVIEVDMVTLSVARSYYIPGIAYVDRLILDPSDSSRMLVLVPLDGIWTLDLGSGATSEFITEPATSFGIRPGTRELFVTSSSAFYLYSFDVDTGALLTSTSIGIEGVWNMHFVDEDVLLLHGYGIGRYNVTGGSVAPLCETVNSDGWGYDWMIATDGERIVQPGYTTNRVRNASDCAVLATDIPETNFYYGSIAPGSDGTFIASGGDLDTDGSMGIGKVRIGKQDSNFSFVAEFDLGDANIIARGHPYYFHYVEDTPAVTTTGSSSTSSAVGTVSTSFSSTSTGSGSTSSGSTTTGANDGTTTEFVLSSSPGLHTVSAILAVAAIAALRA